MTGRVETADGKVYELPALLEWRLRRTGGVPCDSFRVKCLYSAEMGEVLKAACRFAATENGVTRFRGVIDEWSAVCGAEGAVLTVEGRGMAALLLDNEAEAVTYQRAALSEILKDHAAACGVAWEPRGGSCRRAVYVPSRSVNELRYTGRYQIEKSAEDARELTTTLAGSVDAEPMDRVELSLSRLGVRGTFRVSETLYTLSASGETTELTLWEV